MGLSALTGHLWSTEHILHELVAVTSCGLLFMA